MGVIATPEVNVRPISWRDRFLILATDGVWEMIDTGEAVQIVQEFGDNTAAGANALVTIAQERWLATFKGKQVDDVTAMVVMLPTLPTHTNDTPRSGGEHTEAQFSSRTAQRSMHQSRSAPDSIVMDRMSRSYRAGHAPETPEPPARRRQQGSPHSGGAYSPHGASARGRQMFRAQTPPARLPHAWGWDGNHSPWHFMSGPHALAHARTPPPLRSVHSGYAASVRPQ